MATIPTILDAPPGYDRQTGGSAPLLMDIQVPCFTAVGDAARCLLQGLYWVASTNQLSGYPDHHTYTQSGQLTDWQLKMALLGYLSQIWTRLLNLGTNVAPGVPFVGGKAGTWLVVPL